MRTAAAALLAVSAAWSSPLLAQQPKNMAAAFIRQALVTQQKNIVAAADQMPADKYGFTSAPDQMTFGQLVLHVADGNYLFCSKIGGMPAPELPKIADGAPKPALIDRVKSSFDFCNASFVKLDDANMAETLAFGDVKSSRSMSILTLSSTWTTHYQMETSYLELNGLHAPPAAR